MGTGFVLFCFFSPFLKDIFRANKQTKKAKYQDRKEQWCLMLSCLEACLPSIIQSLSCPTTVSQKSKLLETYHVRDAVIIQVSKSIPLKIMPACFKRHPHLVSWEQRN